MPVCHQCDRRILVELRLPLDKLVSLDELSLQVRPYKLDQLRDDLMHSAAPEEAGRARAMQVDAFAACVALLAMRGDLALYVTDAARTCGYRIRPDLITGGCCSWSVWDAAEKRRFITKPSQMLHGSLEIMLDGQPIYVAAVDARESFRLRPTSERRLREIVAELISRAETEGLPLKRAEQLELVRRYPDVRLVGSRRILEIFDELKPDHWRKPGPRAKR